MLKIILLMGDFAITSRPHEHLKEDYQVVIGDLVSTPY